MRALPAPRPVTRPEELTVATFASLLDQTKVFPDSVGPMASDLGFGRVEVQVGILPGWRWQWRLLTGAHVHPRATSAAIRCCGNEGATGTAPGHQARGTHGCYIRVAA